MKKKLAALFAVLALLVCIAAPAGVFASGAGDAAAVASAFRQDLDGAAAAGGKLNGAARSLLKSMAPYVRNVVLTEENTQTLQDLAGSLMRKALNRLQGGEAQPTEPVQPNTQPDAGQAQSTIEDLANFLKRLIFVKVESPAEAAQLIADDAGIQYDLIEDEGGTYYISVDIEKYPQVFDYAVFRNLVDDLVAKQNAEMEKDANGNYDYVMTYEHIAGELAFHMLIWAGAKGVIMATNTNSRLLLKIYESAAQADLNANENRLPSEVFAIVGLILYHFFFFNTLRALGLIRA